MTAFERAEDERREALRAARYESFVQRTLEASRAAREKSEALLRQREKRQMVLEFTI